MGEPLTKQVQHFTEKGFTEEQAVALVHYHQDFIDDRIATKKDIADVGKEITDVRKDIVDVRKEIADIKKDIVDLRKEIAQLRADVQKDLLILKKDLLICTGSIMAAGVVILSVLMKFLAS